LFYVLLSWFFRLTGIAPRSLLHRNRDQQVHTKVDTGKVNLATSPVTCPKAKFSRQTTKDELKFAKTKQPRAKTLTQRSRSVITNQRERHPSKARAFPPTAGKDQPITTWIESASSGCSFRYASVALPPCATPAAIDFQEDIQPKDSQFNLVPTPGER
jgi:hypothetical protein